MKNKLILVLAGLLTLVSFSFAQDYEPQDFESQGFEPQGFLEIGGSYFLISQGDLSISGGGLNFAAIRYRKPVGIGYYMNLTYGNFFGASFVNFDYLFGPVFRLVNIEKFSLPLTIGIYTYTGLAFYGGETVFVGNIGLGGNISANINISENLHLYLRFQGAYAFRHGGELIITPSIGVGFGF